jgi:hypothetical protein
MREGVENSLGEESRDAAGEGRVAESSAPALMFFFCGEGHANAPNFVTRLRLVDVQTAA